jgi:hypothetical protein
MGYVERQLQRFLHGQIFLARLQPSSKTAIS